MKEKNQPTFDSAQSLILTCTNIIRKAIAQSHSSKPEFKTIVQKPELPPSKYIRMCLRYAKEQGEKHICSILFTVLPPLPEAGVHQHTKEK